jgi:hypothetical protein
MARCDMNWTDVAVFVAVLLGVAGALAMLAAQTASGVER